MAKKKGMGPETFEVPAGYRLVREPKSRRMQLLVTPATAASLKDRAAQKGVSLNELANRIFEDYLRRQG